MMISVGLSPHPLFQVYIKQNYDWFIKYFEWCKIEDLIFMELIFMEWILAKNKCHSGSS